MEGYDEAIFNAVFFVDRCCACRLWYRRAFDFANPSRPTAKDQALIHAYWNKNE